MENSSSKDALSFRVGLIERAVAEQGRRLEELMHALSDDEPSDRRVPEKILVEPASVSPFASGFHFHEHDAAGRAYRWTGRGDFFELRVPMNRNVNWTFEMELRGNEHVSVDPLRCFVDYIEIPVSFGGPSWLATGRIPAKPLATHAVLTFYLPGHFIPSKLDPKSVDHRRLSAVFYGLKLAPAGDAK
ncbi:MAG TPA: hypothetical protein VHY79_18885 [Rhizomicrobium sp.]|jgi:hypothetical protein|nr:hypothetical protein [Rhizomicrobium sp.]